MQCQNKITNNSERGQRYKFCNKIMKLNEVLSEIRKGNLVFNLKVITPKGYDKNVEEISIATTIYYKKHFKVREDDEIVIINGKEFNVSEFVRNVNEFKGSEICARMGNRSIVIECEEPENDEDENTYDIHFNDETDSNNKGFSMSLEECKDWIENNRGESYFKDYKGGTVSIVCNETGETVYEENI